MNVAKCDRAAYTLAREYLLSFWRVGVTNDLLNQYLEPSPDALRPVSVPGIYKRILRSAQNRGMSVGVIGKALGRIERLEAVLSGFKPSSVVRKYGDNWQKVLDDIQKKLHPKGKIRRTQKSLWPLFCRTIISGANFMIQFPSADDFYSWVDVFNRDERTRPALPMLLSLEIKGFGFPLACDFLMGLGYFNFAKPDIHLKAIFKGVGLAGPKDDDYQVFKAIARVAKHKSVTPYNVDKLFWVVGSGYFYNHKHIGSRGRIGTSREDFIRHANAKLMRHKQSSLTRRCTSPR